MDLRSPARRRQGSASAAADAPGSRRRRRPSLGLSLLTLILAALPFLLGNDYLLLLFNIIALNALVVLGLNLLIGCAGQISLGHAAFYGLGAYLGAIAGQLWGWPWPLALLWALGLTAATGWLLALPTLRLEGHYLVMATLGFNIIVIIAIDQLEPLTGGPSGLAGIAPLRFGALVLDSDRRFYFFIWGLFLLLFKAALNLADSRVGRGLQAIHDNPLAAAAMGVPCAHYKVAVFVLSAVVAGLAGFCYSHYVTFISPKTFDIFYSVQVVTMVVIGGMGHLWGGLAGTALITMLPEWLHRFEDLHVLLYGLILTGALVFLPNGLVPSALALSRRLLRSSGAGGNDSSAAPAAPTASAGNAVRSAAAVAAAVPPIAGDPTPRLGQLPQPPPFGPKEDRFQPHCRLSGRLREPPDFLRLEPCRCDPILEVRDLSRHFGGLQAIHRIDLTVAPAEMVALIGPNGAGKTTLLNIISGLVAPSAGTIRFHDAPIAGLSPHRIAALGIGRTFQAVQHFRHLNVLGNLLLGYHLRSRAGFFACARRSSKERREAEWITRDALERLRALGLEAQAEAPVDRLSLFQQKVLEIARTLVPKPTLLLLDEPVAGLNPRESEQLMDWIGQFRSGGLSIILVEHDMNMVMRYADRVVVLQHGAKIAEGPPRQIQSDPKVIAAYLGSAGFRRD